MITTSPLNGNTHHITGKKNRSEAIRIALGEFLKQQRRNKVLALRGKVNIEDNWEQLRELEKME